MNINEILRERTETNNILAKNKQISLAYIARDEIRVSADLNMLNTILRNLITNAIKFSCEKSMITLTAEERSDDVLIIVEDQGKGMSAEILEKLFQQDSKISTPGTHNEGGTGLGLLLCKEFVELHSGKIWAESSLGKGSKFFFTLPKV